MIFSHSAFHKHWKTPHTEKIIMDMLKQKPPPSQFGIPSDFL